MYVWRSEEEWANRGDEVPLLRNNRSLGAVGIIDGSSSDVDDPRRRILHSDRPRQSCDLGWERWCSHVQYDDHENRYVEHRQNSQQRDSQSFRDPFRNSTRRFACLL
jgi:hypothetical protein